MISKHTLKLAETIRSPRRGDAASAFRWAVVAASASRTSPGGPLVPETYRYEAIVYLARVAAEAGAEQKWLDGIVAMYRDLLLPDWAE